MVQFDKLIQKQKKNEPSKIKLLKLDEQQDQIRSRCDYYGSQQWTWQRNSNFMCQIKIPNNNNRSIRIAFIRNQAALQKPWRVSCYFYRRSNQIIEMQVLSIKCRELIDFTLTQFSHINVIFLNAGVNAHFHFSDIKNQDMKVFKSLIDVNFYSNVYLTKYALPTIKKFKGKIVVISSLSGKFGLPQRTAYCASKFAITGFFQALRTQENPDQVGIHLVFPTSLNTPMRNHDLMLLDGKKHETMQKDDSSRFDPKQCAQIILQKITKNQEDIYIPFKGKLGVMIQPFFPKILREKLKKMAKI